MNSLGSIELVALRIASSPTRMLIGLVVACQRDSCWTLCNVAIGIQSYEDLSL